MPALKTIIFDMGNVIIPFDFRKGYAALEARSGMPVGEITERIRASGLVPELESGRMEPRPFVEAMNQTLDARLSYAEFCEIWSSIFLPHTLIPEDIVTRLRENHRVMVLSNTNAIHFEMLWEAYPILRHFDRLILSHEVKALKPEPAIYAAALAEAHAEPAECFFTDDVAAYVDGARLAGMQAEQFQGYEKLLDDLRGRGVNV
ncbi:MAG TPA: HAD-IA family hydrolase [Bryobacteraceae bacterium]|nr:HAD-IA family hydrolase [Bryobacteraceae bacterium]